MARKITGKSVKNVISKRGRTVKAITGRRKKTLKTITGRRKASIKSINNSLSIRQVGAKPFGKTKTGKPLFKLGGGVFTKSQIVGSRKRFAKSVGIKFK